MDIEDFEADPETSEDLPNLRLHNTEFDEEDTEGPEDAQAPQQASHQKSEKERTYIMPEVIKNFLLYFHRHLREQNVYEIHSIYENSFIKLTEKYFKGSPWPPVEVVAALVENDQTFLMLYKELYYRHLYSKAKMHLTLQHRVESWLNYSELFNFFLGGNQNLELELPNQWLWDIIDEFIYQFQSWCQFAPKAKPEELAQAPQAWNVVSVLNFLQALVTKSNILKYLERERLGQEQPEGDLSQHQLYRMLGYFSIVGLLRMHCLLGDYWLGLKTLEPIDLTKKGLFSRVTACQITLYYYLGFAYLMMRRYVDAIKTFSSILLYISRTKQYHTRSYQYESIMKKNEQMYALLAIAVSLSPQRIDENVHSVLKEKYADKMARMQRGDGMADITELFTHSCPKFVSAAPTVDDSAAHSPEWAPYTLQLKLFTAEVAQQVKESQLPTIRSFLKLYTTISTAKLASFLEVPEPTLRTYLLCFKHKTRNLVWSGGAPLSGKSTFASDVDFYLDQDMIHIADTKVTRRYGDFFIRHINKFSEIVKNLEKARAVDSR